MTARIAKKAEKTHSLPSQHSSIILNPIARYSKASRTWTKLNQIVTLEEKMKKLEREFSISKKYKFPAAPMRLLWNISRIEESTFSEKVSGYRFATCFFFQMILWNFVEQPSVIALLNFFVSAKKWSRGLQIKLMLGKQIGEVPINY